MIGLEPVITIVVLVFSAILHEFMHGWAADRLGDPTPRVMGRLTLNPIPHIDPLGSILIPALLIFSGSPIIFGAAKPVPVNPLYFKDWQKDTALTALAGPLTNIALAVIASVLYRLIPTTPLLSDVLFSVVLINLILTFVNLVPIPPLDGSKIISAFLPNHIASQYLSIGQYGIFILFFLLLFPIGGFSLGRVLDQLVTSALRLLGI